MLSTSDACCVLCPQCGNVKCFNVIAVITQGVVYALRQTGPSPRQKLEKYVYFEDVGAYCITETENDRTFIGLSCSIEWSLDFVMAGVGSDSTRH